MADTTIGVPDIRDTYGKKRKTGQASQQERSDAGRALAAFRNPSGPPRRPAATPSGPPINLGDAPPASYPLGPPQGQSGPATRFGAPSQNVEDMARINATKITRPAPTEGSLTAYMADRLVRGLTPDQAIQHGRMPPFRKTGGGGGY
jgi:hypothetical protein